MFADEYKLYMKSVYKNKQICIVLVSIFRSLEEKHITICIVHLSSRENGKALKIKLLFHIFFHMLDKKPVWDPTLIPL